ncbi:sensor histidine kinase [Pseudomarimonas arenosa]|uniref:Histidine kinase n=1 Tax=Pseudomarimonas arenosa TaxID=2774145 RepID=A0AAW3ZHF8_9GAMM|nr:histidine kinase [Pseudomarimonas arenosa]MBD8525540.1 histidine kinase [Pseudomarimonas arenosa]
MHFDFATANSNRLFWQLQISGWLGVSLFSYLTALVNGRDFDAWHVTLPVYLVGFVGTLGLRYLLRLWRGLSPLPLAIAMLLPCAVVGGLMSITLAYTWSLAEPEMMKKESGTVSFWLGAMVSYTYLILAWAFLYITLRFYRELQLQTRQALEANAMAHQAQLKMLRYQLNPHFLFNTLNAISTLILDRDTPTANRMVQGLSSFLRHSLDNDPMQKVSLRQELEAIRLYLDIEKVRFAERLRLELDVSDDCQEALMPSLLLQPLIENAIKFAVAKRVEGGRLRIKARRQGARLLLQVTDDGPGCGENGPKPRGDGHGVGLDNTRDRLRVLYGERQSFSAGNGPEGGFQVTMELPFELAAR